ncbi:MAG: (d)CMP kinase [Myxococcaceae bacterium]|nr:(d)CMP kinase [Myxococcaceae bacterium]
MGVSGSGKSTVGAALAARLGWRFLDGDAFHPASNVAAMAAGVALSDADRWPWLDGIARALAAGGPAVLACSALKAAYRARLPSVRWFYLRVPRDVLEARLASRSGHFFSPSLLGSQLDTLEAPAEAVDGTLPVARLVDALVRRSTDGSSPDFR